jgi:anti-sigma factor RsiW
MTWWWHGSHEETERHFSDHLEGELRGLRRWRVLRHLSRCEPCAAALQSLRRTVAGLRSLRRPAPEHHPSVVHPVVTRIRREQEAGG